jgi:hypothetical protein
MSGLEPFTASCLFGCCLTGSGFTNASGMNDSWEYQTGVAWQQRSARTRFLPAALPTLRRTGT